MRDKGRKEIRQRFLCKLFFHFFLFLESHDQIGQSKTHLAASCLDVLFVVQLCSYSIFFSVAEQSVSTI
jgi:hypothetical protein